jgi:hypothetical protein
MMNFQRIKFRRPWGGQTKGRPQGSPVRLADFTFFYQPKATTRIARSLF